MNANSLLNAPLWDGSSLGKALPDSPHAVSVSLPRWQDVVGYEEKRPEVVSKMALGYPRFVIHPFVRELAAQIAGDAPCLPFPSARVAELAAAYVRRAGKTEASVIAERSVFAVVTTNGGAQPLKDFWQHTGLIVSSRQAEAALNRKTDCADAVEVRATLRLQLAGLYDCAPEDVFLAPSQAHRYLVHKRAPAPARPPRAPLTAIGA